MVRRPDRVPALRLGGAPAKGGGAQRRWRDPVGLRRSPPGAPPHTSYHFIGGAEGGGTPAARHCEVAPGDGGHEGTGLHDDAGVDGRAQAPVGDGAHAVIRPAGAQGAPRDPQRRGRARVVAPDLREPGARPLVRHRGRGRGRAGVPAGPHDRRARRDPHGRGAADGLDRGAEQPHAEARGVVAALEDGPAGGVRRVPVDEAHREDVGARREEGRGDAEEGLLVLRTMARGAVGMPGLPSAARATPAARPARPRAQSPGSVLRKIRQTHRPTGLCRGPEDC